MRVVDLPTTERPEPGTPLALMEEMDTLIFGIGEDQQAIRDKTLELQELHIGLGKKQERVAEIINTLDLGVIAKRDDNV